MKKLFIRATGLVLILAAVLGLLICIAGVVWLSHIEGPVTERALAAVDFIGRGLKVAADGLTIADAALQKAGEVLAFVETTVDSLAQVIGDNQPILTSLADVAGEDVPAHIRATQRSLDSAGQAAKLVDDTVAALASLPFLPRPKDSSPVTLQSSLANVSAGLDDLSASFKDIEAGLDSTAGNLERARTSMTQMADDMAGVQRNLAEARTVVGEYQDIVARAQAALPAVRENLPGWIRAIRWAISLTLVWLGIMQIGLLSQGADMLGRGHARKEPQPAARPRRRPALRARAVGALQAFRALASRTT